MDLDIRALSPALLDDYLYFFDHAAFADHREWSGCYCTHFHWDSALEAEWKQGLWVKTGREYAIELIRGGVMQGYLAYHDGKVVGWCNAGGKRSFRNLAERSELWDGEDRSEKARAVVCFLVAPHMRGCGVAAALLDRVCRDAVAEGCEYVEAYPYRGANDVYVNHHGPYELFMKNGFALYKELGNGECIVRKGCGTKQGSR